MMKKAISVISNTIIIEKSKFITSVIPVDTVDDVNIKLKEINKKYYDATHNCYAYILNNGLIQKCSDDGEPAKTAGFPMLEVLKKNDITDCLVVVTRYFGGIKLGAGGLLRAYSSSVSEAIKLASFIELENYAYYMVRINYPTYSRIESFINNFILLDQQFSNEVLLKVKVKEDLENIFLTKLQSLTLGNPIIQKIDIKE